MAAEASESRERVSDGPGSCLSDGIKGRKSFVRLLYGSRERRQLYDQLYDRRGTVIRVPLSSFFAYVPEPSGRVQTSSSSFIY